MSDPKTDLDLTGLGANLDGSEGDARNVSTLIRDLLNRIEQLEEQNSSLRKELDLVIRGAATAHITDPPPTRRRPPETRKKKHIPGSRRAIIGTTAAPGVAGSRTTASAQSSSLALPPHPRTNKLQPLFDIQGDSEETQTRKRSGRVRSKFRRQFRYFSMARLHAILAGLCMTVGAISAAVADMLVIPILKTAGIAFACLGLIYMLGVGVAWIFMRITFAEPGEKHVELPSQKRQRPGHSLISNIIYAISKLLHIATR